MDGSTLFILQIAGPVILVESLALLINGGGYVKNLFKTVKSDSLALFMTGISVFIVSLVVILSQYQLVSTTAKIVTVVAGIGFLKGITILLFPGFMTKLSVKFANQSFLKGYGV